MIQDEIIAMAREAGCWETDTGELITEDISLERFAALVAAHEREAIMEIVNTIGGDFAVAIRARGEK